MMLDDRDSSYKINPLNRIEDEHPFFIIEIVGEPTIGKLMGKVTELVTLPISLPIVGSPSRMLSAAYAEVTSLRR